MKTKYGKWSKNVANSKEKRASADFTTHGVRKSHRRLRSDQLHHKITADDFIPIAQSVTLMTEEDFVASSHQSSRNNNRSRTSNNNAAAKNKTIPPNLIGVNRLTDPSQVDESSERGH